MQGIGGDNLDLEGFYKVLFGKTSIEMDKQSLIKVEDSYRFLEKFSKGKVIYGVNTGFGPMVHHYIKPSEQSKLQYNLIGLMT